MQAAFGGNYTLNEAGVGVTQPTYYVLQLGVVAFGSRAASSHCGISKLSREREQSRILMIANDVVGGVRSRSDVHALSTPGEVLLRGLAQHLHVLLAFHRWAYVERLFRKARVVRMGVE